MALGELGKYQILSRLSLMEIPEAYIKFNFPMFLGTLYENPVTVLENAKWWIQYGGTNIEDLIIC